MHAERIKDIAALAAARPNQLMGYGIVVGLQGTGDGKDISFTIQTLRETLARMGSSVDGPLSSYDLDPETVKDFKIENAAAVMVTAELPAFAKPGQKIDVNVAAIAKAKSLRGGALASMMRGQSATKLSATARTAGAKAAGKPLGRTRAGGCAVAANFLRKTAIVWAKPGQSGTTLRLASDQSKAVRSTASASGASSCKRSASNSHCCAHQMAASITHATWSRLARSAR